MYESRAQQKETEENNATSFNEFLIIFYDIVNHIATQLQLLFVWRCRKHRLMFSEYECECECVHIEVILILFVKFYVCFEGFLSLSLFFTHMRSERWRRLNEFAIFCYVNLHRDSVN